MKIVLTHGYFLAEDPKEQLIMKPYPPLGILYISAYLEQHNFPNEVFDSTFSSIEKLKTCLQQERPDIIGIYTNLMTKLNVLKIISFIKNEPCLQHTKIILGGPEVRNHKEKFLEYGADIIVFGEGEETMLEVVETFSKNNISWGNIAGIAYKNESGNIIANADRILIKDINSLPFANRKKIDLQKYFDAWKQKHGISMLNLSTMRGCPYSCKWCSRAVYGTSYRRRNPVLVVDEIESLQQQYAFDKIWFVDDVFTINPKWLREFASEVQQRSIKISYEIITRADRLTVESVQLLNQSGCFRVWIGAESGSQKIIDAMDRRVKVEQVREMIRLVKSYGMEAGTFIMLGYPGEDEKDIIETLHHLKYSDPDFYTITVAYPIKGTPLYSEVENVFTQDLAWENSTDRDIDFKRSYSRRYYDYAMQWIQCEMSKSKTHQNMQSLVLGLRALKARTGMFWERIRSPKAASV